jgi:hypothetical protein
MGDAGNVLVDGGGGTDCVGAECGYGREIGDCADESVAWADEFADEISRKQRKDESF